MRHERDCMKRRSRRSAYYLVLVLVTTATFTLVYNYGMATLEGRPQSLTHSLEIVFQTFTTTGYGQDAPWVTPAMQLLVIGMQLTGIALILTAADVFVVPILQNALSATPPTDSDSEDHVIICTFTPRGEAFTEELRSRDVDYLVVENDRETAVDLHDAGYPVVYGDPESIDVLEAAAIDDARAVVADGTDEINASIVLSAKEANPEVPVYSLAEERPYEEYHRLAGATAVLSPRQLLGNNLAHRVPVPITVGVGDALETTERFELAELSIGPDSPVVGSTVAESGLRERTDATIAGGWFDGEFESRIADRRLDSRTTLLVAGRPDRLDRLEELTAARRAPVLERSVLVAGYGEAGRIATRAFERTSARVTVLDRGAEPGVDVVGDATDPGTLRDAGVRDASTIVFTLGDDTATIFATLIARDLNSDIQIVARADETDNVPKLYRAGADYVQSLATVSGRMLAAAVLEGEQTLSHEVQLEVIRTTAPGLDGLTPAEADVRARSGCVVLAVERDGEVITEFDPRSFRVEEGDELVLVGTEEDVRRFGERFDDD